MSSEKVVNLLQKIRDPIAEYQDAKGLSKSENYSFVNLVTALCQHAYNAAAIILTMLYNLLPLFEGFTYLLRFMLDKLIDIFETSETYDKIIKTLIFMGQLVILFFLLYFIITTLMIPILNLTVFFVNKIFSLSVNVKN